jgi:hypothetical protein
VLIDDDTSKIRGVIDEGVDNALAHVQCRGVLAPIVFDLTCEVCLGADL